MGEVESLLLVLALLYLSECVVWVRRGALAFIGWRDGACRARTPPPFAANQRGGALLTSLWPSQGAAFLAAPPLVSFSPAGLYAYSAACLDPTGRPREDGPYAAWAEIGRVQAEGRHVTLNEQVRIECVSGETARQVAAWVQQVRKQPARARADTIEQLLAATLDADAVRARLDAGRAASRSLRWLAAVLFGYVFVLTPLGLVRYGFGLFAAGLVVGALAQTLAIAWRFRRAHQRLYPQAGEERFKHFLVMLLAPPAAIRAPEVLAWHLLDTFHPLAIARVVGDEPSFRAFARQVLVDLRWPILPVCRSDDPARREAERWFRELETRVIARFLNDQGIDATSLLTPPERADPANQGFCPRCGTQYVRREGVCADCGGRPLEAFTAEACLKRCFPLTGSREPTVAATESETRARQIDAQLARAGWTVGNRTLIEEFLIGDPLELKGPAAPYQARNEFADYALPDRLRRPLGIVEAKRSSRSPVEGERQAADYADRIRTAHGVDPFIFLANGDEIWFWRRRLYPARRVSGFFTLDDLERLAFLDSFHEPLRGAAVAAAIVDRAYEVEAVKAIAERIEQAFRRFLLVMATGTGKTRTAVALVELLLRQKWVQRVLFLADRRELVKQALEAFREFLPAVPRARIETGEVDPAARVLVATYPGMMTVFPKLSPGYFDLIIADESHRSIYHRYRAILDHFDALQVGLTATPTDFIDHNTFQLFGCEDGLPSFRYGYEEAVRDGYLVPYRPVHVAKTHFQVEGLQPGQLPPDVLLQLQQQGLDAADLTFDGTDLERRVTNTGTNDAIVREFMEASIKDAIGTLPAKAIIFAVSHRHALELYQSFNRLYPDLQQRGLAKIIDSHMERAEMTLDDFKHKDLPRVAISVDMLDTGIDVPAIRNLVFAKPVFSQVKFWQMIGRGTRLWTDPVSGQRKEDFLIIDHWDNFAYFQVNPEGKGAGASTEPLPTRLFRLRLEKLQIMAGRADTARAVATRVQLQTMLGALPLENINVAPHADEIRRLRADADAWTPLDDAQLQHLSATIAPLLRFTAAEGWTVLQFENLTEQLALAQLKADDQEIERLREPVTENLKLLPAELPEIRAVRTELAFALSPGFWDHVDYARIMELQTTFAPLMRFRARREGGELIRLKLPDFIAQRHWIVFGPAGEGAFVDAYREQVEAFVRDLADENPALRKLKSGQDLTDDELESISRLINRPDLFVTEERLREAFEQPQASLADFLRHILGLARLPSREQRIAQAFEDWVARHPHLNATQLMFVRTLRQALLSRARIAALEQLHEPPFSRIGDPERLFTPPELEDMLALATRLAA